MVKKITKWFYLQPFLFEKEPLHLLDISRKIKENHATTRKYLNDFAKEGLLRITQKGRLTLYEINKDFPLLISYISIAEKEHLIKKCSENKIFKELVHDLQKNATKPIIIFGSSAINFAKAEDIDIICLENIKLENIQKKYTKKFHTIQVKKLSDIQETLKKEIEKKHITIYGVEEVVKWLM
jgi:hypothetical protein